MRDLTFVGSPGITGLIGVNGAGKSTLLQVMAGVLRPTSGSCLIGVPGGGAASPSSREGGQQVALMPQDLVLPSTLRVTDFLTYMGWVRGLPRRERAEACEESLERVGLAPGRRTTIGDLSGGMKRRLLLAQAILGSPGVLLLDEPTASLDPEQKARMKSLLATLGATAEAVVVSSHEIDGLANVCDQLVMLEEGRVLFSGTPATLRREGEHHLADGSALSPYEAAFLHLRERMAERDPAPGRGR